MIIYRFSKKKEKIPVIIMTLLAFALVVSLFAIINVNATSYSNFNQDIKVDSANENIEINAAGCTTDKQYKFTKDAKNVTFTMNPSSPLVMDSSSKEHGPIKLESGAEVTIKMYGDITLKGGHDSGMGKNYGHAGIHVQSGATLHLEVNGKLKTYGGDGGDHRGAAGIGSDDDSDCGDMYITVNDGGSIEAYGYHGGAGIGGGDNGSIGTIDIKGTSHNTSILANGAAGGAGIGGANDGKVSNLTIDNIGTINCVGGNEAAGIGGGDHEGVGDGGNIGNITVKNCGTVNVKGGNGGAGIGGGEDADITSITVENCDSVTATSGDGAAGIGTGRDSTLGVDVNCGPITVKNSKVNASCSNDTGAGIGCGGSAHVSEIYIEAQKDITAIGHGDGSGIGYSGGGINALGGRSTNKITINNVQGSVIATAGSNGAGIGLGDVSLSDTDHTIGTITIGMNNGSINATASGSNNAGIGGGRPTGDFSDIRKISITGQGNITSKGTAGGAAIGSGDDSNVKDGIEIIGTANRGDLKLDVCCSNPSTGMATCPIIGIDNPDDDKSDATNITIRNAEITAKVTKTDGRDAAVVIGAGQHGGLYENPGWLKKVELDNCKVTMTGDSGVGVGGNMRVSVDEILINNTDYDGFAIGSMGWDDAMIFSGEKTTNMNKITIKDSNVKAIAKYRQANESCVFTMSGIGGGNKSEVKEIEIDNSNVTAQGLMGGAGIGGGGYTYNSSFLGDFFTVYGDMGDYFGDKITIKNNSVVNATGSAGQVYEYMRPIPVLSPEGTVESVDFLSRNFCGCGSGIGGGGFQSFKEISILNSTVTSQSAGVTNEVSKYNKKNDLNSGAAGIGGGSMGTSDKITIDNSTVTSTGTYSGAGIGGAGKDPEVSDALMKAFSGDVGKATVPDITIQNNSNITAYGGFYGAGIGTGERGTLENITIDGSKVNATGGEGAAGIGGGTSSCVSSASLTIKGSSDVIACGGTGGAGMGTGVVFDKNNVSGSNIFDSINISGLSVVHADGGYGAAAIGGGCGDNNYLTEVLEWSNGSDKGAGTVKNFTVSGQPLIVAACGRNCIDDNYPTTTYKSQAVDVGKGGSFIYNDNPESTKMDINVGTLLCLGSDKYSAWNESFRQSLSANTLSPDTSGHHIDSNGSNKEVYRVSLRVPDITDYTKVNVTVTGDGALNANNQPYYYYTPLYTDTEGELYLWLGEGGENKTNATVTYGTNTYNYVGTSRTDNTGRLLLEGNIKLQDNLKKTYDGEPVDDPPLKTCVGDGDITYTYYKYKWTSTSMEADLTDDKKVTREQIVDAGDYTVRVDLSETEYSTSAYDIGALTVLPRETEIASIEAVLDSSDPNRVICKAKVAGLLDRDSDYGTITFKIKQGGAVLAEGLPQNINSDMTASDEIVYSIYLAGVYDVEADFVCNPDNPNYVDCSDERSYRFDRFTAYLSMAPIRMTYGDNPLEVPSDTIRPVVTLSGGSESDLNDVKNNLVYEMKDPTNDVASYAGGKITAINAGYTFMKVSFAGNDRTNPTVLYVPIIVQRKNVIATPKVSILSTDDTWSNYDISGMTTYRRTREDTFVKYKVDYSSDNDYLQTKGLTKAKALSPYVRASDTEYDIPLIRTNIDKNYSVTLGSAAKVFVGKASRDVTVTCEDVIFGQVPRPETTCNIRFVKRELSYYYSGTTNSGRVINRYSIPPLEAGQYTVTAVLSERPNYTMASSEPAAFTVKRADITPAVHVEDHVYGDSSNIRVDGNKGEGNVTYTYYRDYDCTTKTSIEDGASYAGGEPSNIGTYYVVANVAMSNNFNAATTLPAEFTISRRNVEVVADNKRKTYGRNDPVLTATVNNLVGSDTIEYSLSRNPGEDKGDYTIVASGNKEQGNYEVTYTNGTFTIDDGFTLKFDLDGGTINGNPGPIEYTGLDEGDEIIVPGPPEKEGYEFLYWEGSRYYPGDKYVVHGPHRFTAVWKETSVIAEDSTKSNSLFRTGDDNISRWILAAIIIVVGVISGTLIVVIKRKHRK